MPKSFQMPVKEFLELARDNSWDRPSAWWALCGYLGIEGVELTMHAEYETPEGLKQINDVLGDDADAFAIIMSPDWDT